MQWLPLSRHTAQTSPGTTRFFLSIHLPHLSYLIPCSYWASTCIAALPSCMTLYEISVRQTRDLPVVSLFPHPASFRFHLTVDTLAFGYILPTTGRIRDFNPLETCAAGRTTVNKRFPRIRKPLVLFQNAFCKNFCKSFYFHVPYSGTHSLLLSVSRGTVLALCIAKILYNF